MKSLLLTATALALVAVASGAASAAGTQGNSRVATELNGAIVTGIKNAPASAVKNRGLILEPTTNNGAAAGNSVSTGGNGSKAVTIAPRFLIAAPATGTASGGATPNNTSNIGTTNTAQNGKTNGAPVTVTVPKGGNSGVGAASVNVASNTVVSSQSNNQAQFFIAPPSQGTSSGGVAPVRVAGNNVVTTATQGGNSQPQQSQFFIATPGQGTSSGGAAPTNNGGNSNFGNNAGGNGQPVQVGFNQPQGNFGGQGQFNGQPGAGTFNPGSQNQGSANQGGAFNQNAGQGSNFNQGGNFNQAPVSQPAQAQFIPAVNNGTTVAGAETFPQTQAQPSFNASTQGKGGNQVRATPVTDGADLYRRMVAQGYWAVSVLDANSTVFQVLAVDADHPGYAFLLAVDINWGRVLTVRAIAIHGGSNNNTSHAVPTYQASTPSPTYGTTSGQGYAASYGNTYANGAQSAPNYSGSAYSNGGYGQVSYGTRY